MNALCRAVLLFVAIVATPLFSNSLVLQSDRPLPTQLAKSVERETSLAGLSEHGQPDIYVKIHGDCHVSNFSNVDTARPLGWVERVDGEMLSIIHVDCARIGQALWRIAPNPRSSATQEMLARAIARVIRHELRHITLKTIDHEKNGDYKASLRAEELAAPFQRVSFWR
jgi:hypothetical protein